MTRFLRYMAPPILSLVVLLAPACNTELERPGDDPWAIEDSGAKGDDGGLDNPDAAKPDSEIPPADRCDDGDPCTFGDRLIEGVCTGTPYRCDDGKACTDGQCDGVGGCRYHLHSGFCLHHGTCVLDGASPNDNPCLVCNATADPYVLMLVEGECNQDNACMEGGRCQDGVCQGELVDCDDHNICTTNWCDPALGCSTEPNRLGCDDGDPCTIGDFCLDGECQPGSVVLVCDDENPCTANSCDEVDGCRFTPLDDGTACDNGDACTVGDRCQLGICEPGEPAMCDDGNSCTIASCDPLTGCQFLLDTENPCCASGVNPCDDGNQCTTNICNPIDLSCSTEAFVGPCDNGDACTIDDICRDTVCEAGPARHCDDGNSCTENHCDSTIGCLTTVLPDESDCDDGDVCTVADRCTGGVCRGHRLPCSECPPSFWNPMNILVALIIGSNGHPGNGLDVDGDAATCSPPESCSGGIDNQFSAALTTLGLFIDVNAELTEATQSGVISVLMEHQAPTFDDVPYTLSIYPGNRVSSSCVPTTAVCEYRVEAASVAQEEDCQALVLFNDAQITPGGPENGRLRAGGPGSRFTLPLPLLEGVLLSLTLHHARIEADVVIINGVVTALRNGLIGGAIRQREVIDLIEALPDELFSSIPGGKGLVLTIIPTIFTSDIDTNDDGTKDATSIGLLFSARSATVSGVTP